jgi:Ca2+-binding RTX toxin-like protein
MAVKKARKITGGNADDVINGAEFNDTLSGGAGFDSISGGNGNDLLNGGNGADCLNGDDGNDTLNGGAGCDVLDGGTGDDIINGNAGNDEIFGNAGADTITGGKGADYFAFFIGDSTPEKPDTITDFTKSQGDTLSFCDFIAPKIFFNTQNQTLYASINGAESFEFAVVLLGITDFSQITLI